jgi:deoxycitidine kinase
MAMRRTVLSLEGNIGAGKSTLMRLLRDRGGLCTIDEPVTRWQSVSAPDAAESDPPVNLLELFYNDPKRWAFTFQTYAFLSRAQSAVESLEGRAGAADGQSSAAVVLERSLDSDKHVFATNCLRTGLFTGGEWAVYANYHKWTAEQHPRMNVDGFVYMRTQPGTCQRRCAKRSRSEDAAIGLDYLGQIHDRHEEWLLDDQLRGAGGGEPVDLARTRSRTGVPVLVLDCDREFEDDRARNAEVAQAVCTFAEEVALSVRRD